MISLRSSLFCLFLAVAALASCEGGQSARVVDARTSLDRGRKHAAGWIARGKTSALVPVDPQTTIALAYMERLRLGLGSPFRLIDYAMQDPRLADTTRTSVAWALLARTLDGNAYEVDATALDRAGAGGFAQFPGLGAEHLKIIRDAIDHADDPRTGELAVRIAYELAATEGSLPLHSPRYADNVAALLRDRVLARADASDLVRAASAQHVDALHLLQQWRTQRKFQVEQPALATLPQEQEAKALSLAPRVVDEIRDIGANAKRIFAARPATTSVNASLLSPVVASRLVLQADSLGMPPMAPLVIGARGYDRELLAQPWLTEDERGRRKAFENAQNEERFVARYALLQRTSPFDVVPSLVAVGSAVGMRAMSQEAVWYPGYPGPSTRELTTRYGLRSVTFANDVPVKWRPWLRRMVDQSLSDMQSVLPALTVRGMSIRFQEVPKAAGALAMHDPSQRRLVLPPSTSAGTLAHEIAHDIDWQFALKRYHVRGDYASDRAVRYDDNDGLALNVMDMAVGSTVPQSETSPLAEHARRPTEIFARNVDFFITSALAERGRVNGYLSSMQDELLTGYGTVKAPELTGVAAEALMNILDRTAPAYSDTRTWFLRSYGPGRSLRSYDLARRVIESDIPDANPFAASAPDTNVFNEIAKMGALGDSAVDAARCRAPGGSYNTQLEDQRRKLVRDAAQARARGYAVRRARAVMGRAASRWVAGQLFGGPWNVDGVTPDMKSYLSTLVRGANSLTSHTEKELSDGFKLSIGNSLHPARACSSTALLQLNIEANRKTLL